MRNARRITTIRKKAINMFISSGEIRSSARQQLRGMWGKAAFVFLVYHLIILPYSFFTYSNIMAVYIPWLPSFRVLSVPLEVASFIITGPFALGFANYFLGIIRSKEFSVNGIFYGFKHFKRSFVLNMAIAFLLILWCSGPVILGAVVLGIPGLIMGSIISLIILIVKSLQYSMAFYIMHDDDNHYLGIFEIIKDSMIMTIGLKGELFKLYVSFLGWILLGALTLGVGYLWITPYFELSKANFYENVNGEKKICNSCRLEVVVNLPQCPRCQGEVFS